MLYRRSLLLSILNMCVLSCSAVMSDSLRPYGLWPARLLCLWGFSRQEYWSVWVGSETSKLEQYERGEYGCIYCGLTWRHIEIKRANWSLRGGVGLAHSLHGTDGETEAQEGGRDCARVTQKAQPRVWALSSTLWVHTIFAGKTPLLFFPPTHILESFGLFSKLHLSHC